MIKLYDVKIQLGESSAHAASGQRLHTAAASQEYPVSVLIGGG